MRGPLNSVHTCLEWREVHCSGSEHVVESGMLWPHSHSSTYIGEVENGIRNGTGTCNAGTSPAHYTGSWKSGRRNGEVRGKGGGVERSGGREGEEAGGEE